MAGKITVVARWETTQMDAELEWRMWRQLRGAFGIDDFIFVPVVQDMDRVAVRQAPTMREALAVLPPDTHRCFLEPTGYNTVMDMPREGDIALIVGSTAQDNMAHAQVNETYSIATAGGTQHNHLYGTNAAAIALAVRYGQ